MAYKNKIGNVVRYAVSALVAVVLMYFSFRGVEWSDFIAGLKSCRWGYVVLSMFAGIAAFWLRGLRWRELLLPIDGSITRLTTFNAVNIGYLANFVFPRIGEFVRCGIITNNSASESADAPVGEIRRTKKASYDKVLGTVVLERRLLSGWLSLPGLPCGQSLRHGRNSAFLGKSADFSADWPSESAAA